MMTEMLHNGQIDIVVPWVDGSDREWIKSRNMYVSKEKNASTIDSSDSRFRDWGTLRYLFRGIDAYMPWVRTVHLVTVGHIPEWLNCSADRLHIVKHEDYIPEKYLPTFSSHTIELNMHLIPGLAEQFIYFNDDILVLKPFQPQDFFKNGLPKDYAILSPLISGHRFSVQDIALTDAEVINDNFNKNAVIRRNLSKWFNPCYGVKNFYSLLMMPWPSFSSFYSKHSCNCFLKSTFEEVWEKEYQILDSTCSHRFRTRRDVNQWVMREWQLAKGTFIPCSPNRNAYYCVKNENDELKTLLDHKNIGLLCINDSPREEIIDFNKSAHEIEQLLTSALPYKSSFEL